LLKEYLNNTQRDNVIMKALEDDCKQIEITKIKKKYRNKT